MFIHAFVFYISCNIRPIGGSPTYLCKYFGEIAPLVIKSNKLYSRSVNVFHEPYGVYDP